MPYRKNRAMPESPKITAKVRKAFTESIQNKHGVDLIIPWSDFVFSNVALPPSSKIRKGLELVQKLPRNSPRSLATPAGVFLRVVASNRKKDVRGSFSAKEHRISVYEVADRSSESLDSTLRHELLHFVQYVGENLILVAEDRPAFMRGTNTARRAAEAISREGVLAPHRYGVSKRRSLSKVPKGSGRGPALDIEFMTHALNRGLDTFHALAGLSKIDENLVFTMLVEQVDRKDYDLVRSRRRDFLAAAYTVAAKELNKKRKIKPLLEESLGQAILKRLISDDALSEARTGWTAPTIQEKRDVVEGAERRAEALRMKRARRLRFHTAKKKSVQKPSTISARESLLLQRTKRQKAVTPSARVVKETHQGRAVFSIYQGTEPTGKYFYSQEKADAFVRRFA